MTYRVTLKPSIEVTLAKIPQAYRLRIAKKIDSLAENPRPAGAKKLSGPESLYRVRVGDDRIIDQVRDEQLIVLVVCIGSRGDVYRHLP